MPGEVTFLDILGEIVQCLRRPDQGDLRTPARLPVKPFILRKETVEGSRCQTATGVHHEKRAMNAVPDAGAICNRRCEKQCRFFWAVHASGPGTIVPRRENNIGLAPGFAFQIIGIPRSLP